MPFKGIYSRFRSEIKHYSAFKFATSKASNQSAPTKFGVTALHYIRYFLLVFKVFKCINDIKIYTVKPGIGLISLKITFVNSKNLTSIFQYQKKLPRKKPVKQAKAKSKCKQKN